MIILQRWWWWTPWRSHDFTQHWWEECTEDNTTVAHNTDSEDNHERNIGKILKLSYQTSRLWRKDYANSPLSRVVVAWMQRFLEIANLSCTCTGSVQEREFSSSLRDRKVIDSRPDALLEVIWRPRCLSSVFLHCFNDDHHVVLRRWVDHRNLKTLRSVDMHHETSEKSNFIFCRSWPRCHDHNDVYCISSLYIPRLSNRSSSCREVKYIGVSETVTFLVARHCIVLPGTHVFVWKFYRNQHRA